MVIEISFPRGGRKPSSITTTVVKKKKHDFDLFGRERKNRKNQHKTTKTVKEKEIPETDKDISALTADLLTYRTIQDGMSILGCIRDVQKMTLSIILPGRLVGRVMITNISAPYTQLLHSIVDNNEPDDYKPLKHLFYPGQYVATKVVSIDGSNEKCKIDLSLMPQDVNAQLTHNVVSVGMLLWGAIISCEEHGYVVDLGINNCRAFLPKNCVDQAKQYSVGELLFATVQKCNSTSIATTVHLNACSEKIENMKLVRDTKIDNLLPGMHVDLTISKQLKNGLEGKFLDDFTGYIHEGYLQNTFDKIHSYSIEQIVQARVMYVVPITKFVYFTLKSIKTIKLEKIVYGTLANCKILNNTKGGLYLQIGKQEKGFVSYHRLNIKIPDNSEEDDYAIIRKQYPIGSKHQCRILSFDHLEGTYICSLEKDVVREKIFSYKDLKAGQDVQAIIKEIQNNGLLVQVGHIQGYIKNEHLSDLDIHSYANIKTKYKPNQEIKAKVWVINEETNTLHLTVRPSFMNAKENLASYDEVVYNKQYPGMIKQISTNGLLIQFFGDVHGWVSKGLLTFDNIYKPDEMFKIRQVVTCTVVKYVPESRKLTLSLKPPKITSKRKQIHFGQHVNTTISKITDAAFEVTVDKTGATAVLPFAEITKFLSLTNAYIKSYKLGDKLTNLVCINSNERAPILSMRNKQLKKSDLPNFQKLQPNTILRCSVYSISPKCMMLQTPIENFHKKFIVVPTEDISDSNSNQSVQIQANQQLLAKITNIDRQEHKILASTKLFDCWKGDLKVSVNLLQEFLSEVQNIKEHLLTQNQLVASLELGEQVTGIVKEIKENGSYLVELTNEVLANIQPAHVKKKLSIGSKVNGVVLWWNFESNEAEITACPKFLNKINEIQNGKIDYPVNLKSEKYIHADILLKYENFILAVLRGSNGKRQLIFLPTKLHENHFDSNLDQYKIGQQIKVKIAKNENGNIIALPKALILMNKRKKTLEKKKRQRSLSTSTPDEEPKSKRVKLEQNTNEKEKNEKKQHKNDENKKVVSNIEDLEELSKKDNDKSKNQDNKQENHIENKKRKSDSEETKKDKLSKKLKQKTSAKQKYLEENHKDDNEKRKSDSEEIKKDKLKQETNDEPVLSGANNFWNIPGSENADAESSGDENEEENLAIKQQKKKKMTPAERAEAARLEEERLRKIEIELADSDAAPKTADQFDRLVLANPNNSALWIGYMAFHLEATEIEKARAIARKALSTIEFREEQEKLNVWLALLNLENRYGTRESFDSVLDESVQMNDSLTVYIQALNILSDSKKTTEFVELLQTVSRKFKQSFKMWTEIAEACYKCDLKEDARNLMQRALKSLDEKQHVNLLVQFAFMEARHNDPERAEALLEKVLASYPRRVDVWTSYVDMLIKGERYHIARNVLERAASQRLPARKMKTIFTKYIQFETKYGNEDSVKKVREMAASYVKTVLQ